MEAPLPVTWFVPDMRDPFLFRDNTHQSGDEAGPIIPRGWARSLPCDDTARWKRWWKALSCVRAVSPDIANLAHLLALGSLRAADHFVFQDAARPWAADRNCALCSVAIAESLSHLFTACPVSLTIWRRVQGPLSALPSLGLSRFVCPAEVPGVDELHRRFAFLSEVWQLRNRHRNGHVTSDLPIITLTN
jgi:hypothetical protein